MKKLMIGVMILVLIGGTAWATDYSSAPDPTAAAYGARPLGMGGAFVSIADDTNAIFVNPAGLSTLKDWSITSMSTQLLQKIDYTLAGGTYKIGPGTLGIGYIGTSSTAGLQYDSSGNLIPGDPISFTSALALVSYGLSLNSVMGGGEDLGDISVGGTVKFISKGFTGIDGANASGMDFDLGATIRLPNSPFAFGGALKNVMGNGSVVWGSGTKENLDQAGRLGASVLIFGKDGLYQTIPGDLRAALDAEFFSGGKPMALHAGAEYTPISYISIRAGLDQDPLSTTDTSSSLTAGVGVNFQGFHFDYAYRMNPDAQELSNHYFSLSYIPEEVKKEVKEEVKTAPDTKVVNEEKKPAEEKKAASDDIYQLPDEYQNIKF